MTIRALVVFSVIVLEGCLTTSEQPDGLDDVSSADVYAAEWEAPHAPFHADGSWDVEHRWDEVVSGITFEQGFHGWVSTLSRSEPVSIMQPPGAGASSTARYEVPAIDCADWAIALRFVFAATHRLSFELRADQLIVRHSGFVGSHARVTRDSEVTRLLMNLGLPRSTAHMAEEAMENFGAMHLASDVNTYRVTANAALAGDMLALPTHVQVLGRLERGYAATSVAVIQSSPNRQPRWSGASAYLLLVGATAGTGPRRFRTEAPTRAASSPAVEREQWTRLLALPWKNVLEQALIQHEEEVWLRPASCHGRTRLADVYIQLYRARLAAEPRLTWQDFINSRATRVFEVFPELDYNLSPTCSWNPTDDEGRSIYGNSLAEGRATAPFLMRNGSYAPYQLPNGIRWRNDENRSLARMNDVLGPRVCSFLNTAARQRFGCGAMANTAPELSVE